MTHSHTHPEDLIEALRSEGLRITAARTSVCEVLCEEEGHISAEEIYELTQHKLRDINLASVYRTLATLSDLGLVQEIMVKNSPSRWELTHKDTQLHLHCVSCETVEHHPVDEALDNIFHHIKDDHGFSFYQANLVLSGTCTSCREQRRELSAK